MRAFEDVLRDVAHDATRDISLPPGAAARALSGARRTRRRRWSAGAAAVLVVAVAVTLGIILPASQSSVATVTPATDQPLTTEASRLLTLVDLPAGAHATSQRPAHLSTPPTEPMVPGLVDRTRFVAVPLSPSASLDYLRAHTPRGLQTESVGGQIGGPGYQVDYGMWFDPSPAGLGNAQLLISLETVGPNSTVWRLDGQIYPTANHPWWYTAGTTNCGTPIEIRLHDSIQSLGTCAGLLPDPPLTVRLRIGDRLDLHVAQGANGVTAVPIPTIDQPGPLKVIERDPSRSTLTYQAVAAGATDLATTTPYCLDSATGRETPGSCPVLHVIVTK